jgi:PST family polysaccharide transporter
MATAFWLRLVGGCIASGAAYVSALVLGDGGNTAFLVFIVSLGFLPSALEVIELWFQKNIQARLTVRSRVIAVAVSAALKLLLVYLNAPLVAFAAMQAVEVGLIGLALLWLYSCNGRSLTNVRPSLVIAKRLLKLSWPLVLSGIMIAIYFRSEQLVIKSTLGDQGLGVYYASVRVMEMWALIPFALLTTIYPVLVARHARETHADFSETTQLLYDLMTCAGVAVAVVVTLTAGIFVPLVFGPAFSQTTGVLIIHAWTAPVTFSASVRAQIMLLEDATLFHVAIAGLGLVFTVPVAIVLTKEMGVSGAALSMLGGYWLTGYLSSFLFPKLRGAGYAQTRALYAPLRLAGIIRSLSRICAR